MTANVVCPSDRSRVEAQKAHPRFARSRSDAVMVAVAFKATVAEQTGGRRGATVEINADKRIQASLRDVTE